MKLTRNFTPFGGATTGGHYVQVSSDRRLHWSDSVRDIFVRGRPVSFDTSARCKTPSSSPPATFAMRDVARAIYDLQLQDRAFGLGSAFLELTVTRDGRDNIAGIVHYPPALENLDPRLKRAQAIFGRYAAPRRARLRNQQSEPVPRSAQNAVFILLIGLGWGCSAPRAKRCSQPNQGSSTASPSPSRAPHGRCRLPGRARRSMAVRPAAARGGLARRRHRGRAVRPVITVMSRWPRSTRRSRTSHSCSGCRP